jgi:hypothetical protein
MRNPLKPVLELRANGAKYLTRWSLFTPHSAEPGTSPTSRLSRWWVENVGNVYLHRLHGPDPDRAVHNHPWRAVCLVLRGGYMQIKHTQNANGSTTVRYEFVGGVNHLRWNEYHKIVSVRPNTWTLCVHGPVRRVWGFLTSAGHVDHATYLNPPAPVSRLSGPR